MPTLTLHRGEALDGTPGDSTPALRLVSDDVIHVAVAGSHRMTRAGLRLLLDDQSDLTVTGEADSGHKAVELVRRTRPDVVLIDSGMPRALATTRRILDGSPRGHVSVLLLAADASVDRVLQALRAGARGLLAKGSPADELLRAVRVVARGDALLSPQLTRMLIARCLT